MTKNNDDNNSIIYLDTLCDNRIGGDNVDENKNKLKKLLSSYGLDTTIDQKDMTKRIWEWVMSCDSNLRSDSYTNIVETTTTKEKQNCIYLISDYFN